MLFLSCERRGQTEMSQHTFFTPQMPRTGQAEASHLIVGAPGGCQGPGHVSPHCHPPGCARAGSWRHRRAGTATGDQGHGTRHPTPGPSAPLIPATGKRLTVRRATRMDRSASSTANSHQPTLAKHCGGRSRKHRNMMVAHTEHAPASSPTQVTSPVPP